MFAPRSHSVLPKLCPPIEHGMVKLPGSFSLGEILLLIKALEHLVIATVSCSSSFRFLDKMSFRNFTQFGISSNASTNRMLICNCFRMFKNFLDYVSWFVFWSLWGRVSVVNTLSSFFSQSPMVQLCPFFFFFVFFTTLLLFYSCWCYFFRGLDTYWSSLSTIVLFTRHFRSFILEFASKCNSLIVFLSILFQSFYGTEQSSWRSTLDLLGLAQPKPPNCTELSYFWPCTLWKDQPL